MSGLLVSFSAVALVPLVAAVRWAHRRHVRRAGVAQTRDALAVWLYPGSPVLEQPDGTRLGAGQPPTTDSISPRVPSGVVPTVPPSDAPSPRQHLGGAVAPHRRAS